MELIIKKFEDLTVDELYEILKVRSEVFVVEQECIYLDIDENGIIVRALDKVKAADNPGQMLEGLQ